MHDGQTGIEKTFIGFKFGAQLYLGAYNNFENKRFLFSEILSSHDILRLQVHVTDGQKSNVKSQFPKVFQFCLV